MQTVWRMENFDCFRAIKELMSIEMNMNDVSVGIFMVLLYHIWFTMEVD